MCSPELLLWNDSLSESLQLGFNINSDAQNVANIFSGNHLPDDAQSIALAYAGHQFGHFNPSLGDGRAHLLGEVQDSQGIWQDIQLKGSGPTAFSRQGDGRCAIGPAIREFLMSEALYYLGVPTTRCLAVVATGEKVYRENVMPGAVVTRVAQSHLRIGNFQYLAARGEHEALRRLANYSIDRLFPEIDAQDGSRWLTLLERVMHRQISLVSEWARIGFIHGVMNTDNTAISGQTIDYGPCAMLEVYDPKSVFSSIDRNGRYAFANQPTIARWNLIRFAECLIPLIDDDADKAIAQLEPIIQQFSALFETAYLQVMTNKLGIAEMNSDDGALVQQLLENMTLNRMDYTQTFNRLRNDLSSEDVTLRSELKESYIRWRSRIKGQENQAAELMAKSNPLVIPRNYIIESIIREYETTGSSKRVQDFLKVIRNPYQQLPESQQFQSPAPDGDEHYQTFCGT